MKTYKKIVPDVIVKAVQWFKHGDHPNIGVYPVDFILATAEGTCYQCKKKFTEHGVIPRKFCKGRLDFIKFCPGSGDWVIEDTDGYLSKCSRDDFECNYEGVN